MRSAFRSQKMLSLAVLILASIFLLSADHQILAASQWTYYNTSNSGLPTDNIRAIAIDHDGSKWFGTVYGGLAHFDGNTWTVYNASNSGLPHDVVNTILVDSDGSKWIGTDGFAARFDGSHWTTYNGANSGIPQSQVTNIIVDNNGTKWFTTWGGGLASFDGSTWHTYTTGNSGLPSQYVSGAAVDHDGSMWFGTVFGGVAHFDGSTWTVYDTSNSGLPNDWVMHILVTSDGSKWFSTNGGGLAHFDGTNWTVYNTSNSNLGTDSAIVWLQDRGGFWIGAQGLVRFDGTNWTMYDTSNSGIAENAVNSLAEDNSGSLWIGHVYSGTSVFAGGVPPYSMSGQILNADGTPNVGVKVSAGSRNVAFTNTGGYYTVTTIVSNTYVLTPMLAGFSFAPVTRAINVPPSGTGQNFLALATSTKTDLGMSTLNASPQAVAADGTSFISITIMLKNAVGQPVPGESVQVESTRGALDIIAEPISPTDAAGAAMAQIRSPNPGSSRLSVWINGSGLQLASTALVTFTVATPVPDVLRNRAYHTVNRTQLAIGNMWRDTQAVVNEAGYFRVAVGADTFKLGAGILSGLSEQLTLSADPANAVPAEEIGAPSSGSLWDSPAWGNEDVCKISNAFINDATGLIGNESAQRLLRIPLRYGLYLLAAQKNNACLKDLNADFFTDASNISGVIAAQIDAPPQTSPIGNLVTAEDAALAGQLARLNAVRLPPLAQTDVDAYLRDTAAREAMLTIYENRVSDARNTLEAVHAANAAGPVGGDLLQTFLRLIGKWGATAAFDGPGQALVSGFYTLFDTYMNAHALSDSLQMSVLAQSTLSQTSPEAISGAADDVNGGLDRLTRGLLPDTPQGTITNVQHVSQGYYWGGLFWREQGSYSTFTLTNTGQHASLFYPMARYLAQTTRLGVPWAALWMEVGAPPVLLAPNETRTVRIDYFSGSQGYSPREQQSLPGVGQVPASSVDLTILAANPTGVFFVAHDYTPAWVPVRAVQLATPGHIAGPDVISAPTIDVPLVVMAGATPSGANALSALWVNNPFSTSVAVTVTQPLLPIQTVVDPGGGMAGASQITWTGWVPPLASQMFTYTFALTHTPGISVTLLTAQVELASPNASVLTDTAAPASLTIPWPATLTRQTPDWIVPDSPASLVVTTTTLLTVPISGSVTLSVTTPAGSALWANSQPFSVTAQQTQTLVFDLPLTLTIGNYRAIGLMSTQSATGVAFDDPLSVGAKPPELATSASPVAGDGTVPPGTILTYTVWVTNVASIDLTNITISATVPVGTSVVAGSIGAGGAVVENNVRWMVGALSPGAMLALTYSITIPPGLVSGGNGQYLESGATLTSHESPPANGLVATVLVINPTGELYLPLVQR